jgi:methyltransferase (TIGR00027 family)
MQKKSDANSNSIPDHTAVRVALWRAMHVQVDAKPHVLEDEIGLKLIAPNESWRQRPDMHIEGTKGYRAGIVARARFIEDLVVKESLNGIQQYVILGAGLDTFAQRKPEIASHLRVFEIDKHETQDWKRKRLNELGYATPDYLRFVSVNFEAGDSWLDKLKSAGFETNKPAIVASTGVAMYLSKQANLNSLRQIATLAPGTKLAMTFLLTLDLVDSSERTQHEMVYDRARAAGTPIISFFTPSEILNLARDAGFRRVEHVSGADLIQHYFAGRADGLRPASGEEFLIATV